MNAITTRNFFIGQTVTFRERLPEDHDQTMRDKLIEDFGQGPFLITKVKAISTKCNCRITPGQHHPECNLYALRNAAHHQIVTIAINNQEVAFSGCWLELVE